MQVCDVTLRDGEQAPGVVFTEDEKIEIALMLDEVGVEVVEAGFPPVSDDERKSVRKIAELGLDADVCCLARAFPGDVDIAAECDVDIVSVFLAASKIHRVKYDKPFDNVLENALKAVERGKDYGLTVRFALEDASRTDPATILKFFNMAEEAGADYLSIADTVGILTPSSTRNLVCWLKERVSSPLCIHCHDDLGMATANTLTALECGVEQVHTTVNGIGERAGNASLEEVLLGLFVHFGIKKYKLELLCELSKMVERFSGMKVAPNKAVVGSNAFTHESGIHVSAVLRDPRTYELIPPELVGASRRFVIGKHTGRGALMYFVRCMGYELNKEEVEKLMRIVKHSGRKGGMS